VTPASPVRTANPRAVLEIQDGPSGLQGEHTRGPVLEIQDGPSVVVPSDQAGYPGLGSG
jgi:hypothetical protein